MVGDHVGVWPLYNQLRSRIATPRARINKGEDGKRNITPSFKDCGLKSLGKSVIFFTHKLNLCCMTV